MHDQILGSDIQLDVMDNVTLNAILVVVVGRVAVGRGERVGLHNAGLAVVRVRAFVRGRGEPDVIRPRVGRVAVAEGTLRGVWHCGEKKAAMTAANRQLIHLPRTHAPMH